MRKIYIAIAFACALAGSTYFFLRGESHAEANGVRKTVEVKRQDLEVRMKSFGVVEPRTRVDIKPPMAGSVDSVLVKEGDQVTEGQLLAWISSTERTVLMAAAAVQDKAEAKRWARIYRPIPILAPISGTVISNSIKQGQSFAIQDALFSISDRLIVKAKVDEVDITSVGNGMPVSFKLDAMPDRSYEGQVSSISFDIQKVSNISKYSVDIDVGSPIMGARSGMTANVSFLVRSKKSVLVIPKASLVSEDGRWFVNRSTATAKGDPAIEKIEVVIGDQADGLVEVAQGLAEHDLILGESTDAGNPALARK